MQGWIPAGVCAVSVASALSLTAVIIVDEIPASGIYTGQTGGATIFGQNGKGEFAQIRLSDDELNALRKALNGKDTG